MKFNRIEKNKIQKNKIQNFPVGKHQAKIANVQMTESKNENEMFKITVSNEYYQGFYYLTFDTAYTEDNLNYILMSIEDNGEEIPDIDFGYTYETAQFLEGKSVYIEVEEEYFQKRKRTKISSFLSLDEYEESNVISDEDDDRYF